MKTSSVNYDSGLHARQCLIGRTCTECCRRTETLSFPAWRRFSILLIWSWLLNPNK